MGSTVFAAPGYVPNGIRFVSMGLECERAVSDVDCLNCLVASATQCDPDLSVQHHRFNCSTLGSLVIGFVLMDHFGTQAISMQLAVAAALTGVIAIFYRRGHFQAPSKTVWVLAILAIVTISASTRFRLNETGPASFRTRTFWLGYSAEARALPGKLHRRSRFLARRSKSRSYASRRARHSRSVSRIFTSSTQQTKWRSAAVGPWRLILASLMPNR